VLGWLFESKEREMITTSIDFYDSPTDVNLYWDDVIEVLSFTEDGSENSVKKLKEKYNLQYIYENELYVTLETPKHAGYRQTRDHYPGDDWDFTVKNVQRIYHEELEYRKQKAERKTEKQQKEKLQQERNTTEKLQEDLKKIIIKRRTK